MCLKWGSAYGIILLFVLMGIGFADYDEPLANEQVKMILIQRLLPDIASEDSIYLTGEASIRFAVLDTPMMAITSWAFYYHPAKMWTVETPEVRKISLYSPVDVKWYPTDAVDIFTSENLSGVAELLIYPFYIASKRVKGYSIRAQKKRIEIGGVKCHKIAIKPIYEDNDEESPLWGHVYISDDKTNRIVRIEHQKVSANATNTVRWDFKYIAEIGCDFPFKLTVSTRVEMCNFKFSSDMKIYFSKLSVVKTSDMSDENKQNSDYPQEDNNENTQ